MGQNEAVAHRCEFVEKEASHAKIAWMLAALNWSPLTLRPSKAKRHLQLFAG
ncbi:hypothetical protein [Halogeometricum borinquense]|uniref:hypothetical protein n=1 Tax=Halogeometricum borinquense TaxID=60847 RepID=UPI001375BAA7|nr:hypothetical protein [Halogeometricum borinquense]